MNEPKIISEKTIFTSKYFHIDQMLVERKGKQFTKDFVIRQPVVFVIPLTKNNEIYLIKQARDALRKITLEIVAGNIEDNEDILESAKRELKEEAGLTADSWKKIITMQLSANMIAPIHVYLAQEIHEGEPAADEDEEIEVVKLPFARAVEKAMTDEIEVGTHKAVLLMIDKLMQEKKITL